MRWTDMGEKEMIKAWAAEEYAEGFKEGYLPQQRELLDRF